MKPHKHAELIKQWADGKQIQTRCLWLATGEWSEWADTDTPAWHLGAEYRIKPEPKPDVYCIEYFYLDGEGEWSCTNMVEGNLKLTFDGETGKLKDAEVLK